MIRIGERFGNFQIQAEVGRGGMGTIYFAVDTMLNREVALKVIHPQYSDNAQLMERFKIEAMTQARMNHPGIVLIFSFNHIDNDYAIAMEYVEGRSLKEMLQERGHLDPLEAMDILEQILDGLCYAHSRNVIHRDIKPANILVSRDNRVKLSDFGIAKILGVHGLTKTGMLVGTPWYTSPEQIIGHHIDFRTDIYSLGITFYEMLAGRVPFDSETNSEFQIQKAHLETPPPRPSLFNPDISLKLERFVLKALQKDVNKRFSSAREMLAELQALRKELAAATAVRTALESPPPFLRPRRRARWMLPAGVASLVAVVLLVLWLMRPTPSPVHREAGGGAASPETGASSAPPVRPPADGGGEAARGQADARPTEPLASAQPTVRGGEPLLVPGGVKPEPPLKPAGKPASQVAAEAGTAKPGMSGAGPETGAARKPQPAASPPPARPEGAAAAPPATALPASGELVMRMRELALQNRLGEAERLADLYLQKPVSEQDVRLLAALGAVKFASGRLPDAGDLWRRALEANEWVALAFVHLHERAGDRCQGQLRFRRGTLMFNSQTRPDHSFRLEASSFRDLVVRPRRRELVLLAEINGQPLEWRLVPITPADRVRREAFLAEFVKTHVF